MTTKDFMVMLRGSWKDWNRLGPEEMQRILEQYGAWVESLKAQGRFKGGHALNHRSKLIRGEDGALVDGPYAETKEALTGYFLIAAASHDEAVEIARGCPALSHGESVEVIPLGHA